jgi:hypothetical protein
MKMTKEINSQLANEMAPPAEPVPGFPIKFSWHKEYWPCIFDNQIELIRGDIRRARADGKLIVYLSCPISARGGGDQSTNVEIAKGVERRLLSQWGERFWILNPAQYQLESKEGTGLMEVHAKTCDLNLRELRAVSRPAGGDYMRMWTKVLVEDQVYDEFREAPPKLQNSGQHFDAYYFLGPKDVSDFFSKSGATTLTAGIEAHFSRKFATDSDFHDNYTISGIVWSKDWQHDPALKPEVKVKQTDLRKKWTELRRQYLRFYSLRASINFSLGSHDEWEIFRQINIQRRDDASADDNVGIPDQLGGFFDQSQIDPSACEAKLSRGYAR